MKATPVPRRADARLLDELLAPPDHVHRMTVHVWARCQSKLQPVLFQAQREPRFAAGTCLPAEIGPGSVGRTASCDIEERHPPWRARLLSSPKLEDGTRKEFQIPSALQPLAESFGREYR